jgi:hypothetical protein
VLQLVDEAIEHLLRAAVPLEPADVDVTFTLPEGPSGSARALPAVNVLLWGVHRSGRAQGAGVELVEIDGRLQRRAALPVVDCHYLVSAWATEPRDEHHLLGAVVAVLLEHPELPAEHLPAGLATVPPTAPPTLAVSNEAPAHASELLSSAGHPFKAAVGLIVTLPVDAAAVRAAGPPVTRYIARVTDGDATSERTLTSS